ncbi:hypothetical protein [Leifsonia sp. Root227]|uniref:hypothetical protein n=1 Tax=Leifsonia sp. Root227 TaxID=1736496 RepID=UPI000A8DFE55|nr:hypothetical protein [Leifsonia sp. Root227]
MSTQEPSSAPLPTPSSVHEPLLRAPRTHDDPQRAHPLSRILRRPIGTVESIESSALLVGAAVFVIGGVVALFVFWNRDLPISGRGSIGEYAAIGGAVTAAVVFALGRILVGVLPQRDAGARPPLHLAVFDVVALSVAVGLIALLAWTAVSDVVERSFLGAVVFTLPGAVLAGVALALTAYVVFLTSVQLTSMLLSLVLAVFLVVGVFTSMLSSSDPLWWQKNLSALGMTDDLSAFAFNLTLIVGGAIVVIIARVATAGIATPDAASRRGRDLVRWAFVLIGVFLGCVGVFPVDRFFVVHNSVATGMAVVFAALVVGLRWWVPAMPRVFILLGYVYVGVVVVLAVFFATGYYNLTAVELVAAILIFSWIILFLRNSQAIEPRRSHPENAS